MQSLTGAEHACAFVLVKLALVVLVASQPVGRGRGRVLACVSKVGGGPGLHWHLGGLDHQDLVNGFVIKSQKAFILFHSAHVNINEKHTKHGCIAAQADTIGVPALQQSNISPKL